MKTAEVTKELIGKRVSCVNFSLRTTGVITDIYEDEDSKGVVIKMDQPILCGGEWFYTHHSTSRKYDDWGNLNYTELI